MTTTLKAGDRVRVWDSGPRPTIPELGTLMSDPSTSRHGYPYEVRLTYGRVSVFVNAELVPNAIPPLRDTQNEI